MTESLHLFHIPVMGTGHSADTPIRVAPFGISSVISLVDDFLLEKLREHYSRKHNLTYTKITRHQVDGRAKRISAYLDLVSTLVHMRMEQIRGQSFFEKNDKEKYFELLPDNSALKVDFIRLRSMPSGFERDILARELAAKMKPGSIDVNIMVKLDRTRYDAKGQSLGDEFTDGKSALRGFANSCLSSSIVFSAGINPRLFSYLTKFKDFYRDACGELKKKIILKVSDFRSALIQSKFLAKHGLEVSEYRVESGLNCGGHAFPAQGQILPWILKEFKEKWQHLTDSVRDLIREAYEKRGWNYISHRPLQPQLTAQGGIGTCGETQRLKNEFGINRTGWGSPFLLVPEATNVDEPTRQLLCDAKESEFFLSDISPLNIPFNTVRGTGTEIWTEQRIAEGRPGSPCPSGFSVSNTEFTDRPICLASRQYQKKKLEEIDRQDLPDAEKEKLRKKITGKMCICSHLGNGVLIKLGLTEETKSPPAICPGPNLAWFNSRYTLKEMVDHIYGRAPSLVPPERPHMFAKEIVMNVDYLEKLVMEKSGSSEKLDALTEFIENLEKGMNLCLEISDRDPFPDENMASIGFCVREQRVRLDSIRQSVNRLVGSIS